MHSVIRDVKLVCDPATSSSRWRDDQTTRAAATAASPNPQGQRSPVRRVLLYFFFVFQENSYVHIY